MKCIDCGKGIRHSQKGFTWREEQRCSKCYMQKNDLEKVKHKQEMPSMSSSNLNI